MLSQQQLPDIVDALIKAYVKSSLVDVEYNLRRQNTEIEFKIDQLEIMAVRKEARSQPSSGGSSKYTNN